MPKALRRFFWFLNKFFMVPMFRLGFGPLFGNPFSGYILVLKVIGRISGRHYFAPVNYAIFQRNIYCVSGGRKSSDWYKNILANPDIEVILPSGAVYCHVAEELDPSLRLLLIRQVLKNAGFAGFFEGYNPRKISDEDLVPKIADMPLLRLQPLGLASGPYDAGGWMWITVVIVAIAIILLAIF